MCLSLELPGRSPWLLEYIFELYLSCTRRYCSSDHPPICILLIKSWVWTIHYHLFVHRLLMLSAKAQGPIYDLGPKPYNNPSKLRFFSLSSKEKSGVLIFCALILFFPLICTRGGAVLHAPSLPLTLQSPRGVINCSRRHYVPYIQQWGVNPMADISPWVLSGITPTQSCPLYKAFGEIISLISQVFKLSRDPKHSNSQSSLSY